MFSFTSLSTVTPPQPKATIELFLDNSIVVAGSSITGRVVLTVFAEHIIQETIILEVSGNESATYSITGDRGVTFYNSEFKVLDTTFPLAICPGGFRQGQHTFSVDFLLPANLPPSFCYKRCGVSYSLKAFLDLRSHGHPPNSKLPVNTARGCHLKQFVLITPSIDMVPVATFFPVNEYLINYLGCCSAGCISFGAFLPNSVICAGEAFDIYYVIENNSKGKVLELSVSIEGTLTYSAASEGALFPHTHREVHRMTSVHQIFGETQLVGNLSPKTPRETSGKTIDELTRDLVSGSCGKVSVTIPQSAEPSIKGKGGFINLDYRIVLTLRASWGFTKVLTSGLTVHRNGLQPISSVLAVLTLTPTLRVFADHGVPYDQEMATIY